MTLVVQQRNTFILQIFPILLQSYIFNQATALKLNHRNTVKLQIFSVMVGLENEMPWMWESTKSVIY